MEKMQETRKALAQVPDGALVQLPLELLTDFPNDRQPFRPAANQSFEALRQDIARNGLISPLIVRPMQDGSYQILDGRSRYKAAAQLGIETLPCKVRHLDDKSAIRLLIDGEQGLDCFNQEMED